MTSKRFSIARVITKDPKPEDRYELMSARRNDLQKACRDCPERVTVMQTPGGFINDLAPFGDDDATGEESTIQSFKKATAFVEAETIPRLLTGPVKQALQDKADYLTLGVDIWSDDDNCPKHAELVGTYDTRQGRFVAWTGKSYPIGFQAKTLLYCMDLNSHFQTLGNTRALVLGCHDLNMFSPRSRASTAEGTYKAMATDAMQKLCDKFRPEVVLQHPHYTDSANIWMLGWVGVQRWVPSVHTYASGIHYGNMQGDGPRKPLKSVLSATRMGEVRDFVMPA